MRAIPNKNYWLFGSGLFIVLLFLSLRPLRSPSYRLIAADGLGYYAYLPAQFIYHDTDFEFAWFNQVFERHYDNNLFAVPTENFMVPYKNKRINKYYPGQSLLQLPFFFAGHIAAKLSGYPADGFSTPYQIAIGLSAVFYVLVGLLFSYKLLSALFKNEWLALLVPLLLFFGSNLFTYTIFSGCYSHAYSYGFMSLALYYTYKFFNDAGNRLRYMLQAMLFALVVLSIRPLNGLLLIGLLYFAKPFPLKEFAFTNKNKGGLPLLVLLMLLVLAYSLRIIYTQTHSFLINTYIGEKFYFDDWSHIADNFAGFQYGMLWYTPLLLLCLAAVLLAFKQPRLLILALPVLFVIILYSFWWYWNIVARAVVDATAILAILLAVLLVQLRQKRSYRLVLAMAIICVPFFQLKAYQLRKGILDTNYTYFKYYAKYFFTLRQVNVYPVDPKNVVMQEEHFQDFESDNYHDWITRTAGDAYEGQQAAVLSDHVEFTATSMYKVPAFVNMDGFKKFRVAFWIRAVNDIHNIHLICNFAHNGRDIAYMPFYMKESLRKNKWDLKEFGAELPANVQAGDTMQVYLWNPDRKNKAVIDNLKVEFFLTNGAEEIRLK